jgi:hypothetical protein
MGETKSKYLKLNTDAALNIYDLTGATGSIIRDTLGNFVVASCKYIAHVPPGFS